MIITTTNNIENYSIKRYLGVVNANIVIGANFFSDFAASLTDVFGGRSNTYQNKLNTIYKEVMAELKAKAKSFQADAIVGLHIDFDEVSGGGKSMFMVSASGTAVMIENNFEEDTSCTKLSVTFMTIGKKDFYQKKNTIMKKQGL